jgi:SAM-dependent methyltransferase
MMRVHPVATAGFGAGAEVYERARPSYPVEAVEWLVTRTGLGPGMTIVDVGAGTGKLTRLLPPIGARVIAVEPLPEMRAKLLEVVDGVEAIDGTAEKLPLPGSSADVIVVAQAFHWFDLDRALPELHRVLRPGGQLALFWNMRDLEDPVQAGVEELLRPLRADVIAQHEGEWRVPLEKSPWFGPAEVGRFTFAQSFTADDLCDRVASTSFVAAMPVGERDELLMRVRALASGLAEPFPFPYRTEVHLVPRSSHEATSERGTSNQG